MAATTENDVLCAYNETPTWKQTNQLTFEHIFARLGLCTITAPAGYTGSNLSVTVKPKVSGNYNLRTGAWSGTVNASGDVTITTSFDGGGSVNDIYLVPGRYTIKASYTLSKGTYSQDFSRSASVEVQPGKINLITATLPEGEATDLLFSVTVSPWTNCTLTPSF